MNREELEKRVEALANEVPLCSQEVDEDALMRRFRARQEAYRRHMEKLFEGGADYSGSEGWRHFRRRL